MLTSDGRRQACGLLAGHDWPSAEEAEASSSSRDLIIAQLQQMREMRICAGAPRRRFTFQCKNRACIPYTQHPPAFHPLPKTAPARKYVGVRPPQIAGCCCGRPSVALITVTPHDACRQKTARRRVR